MQIIEKMRATMQLNAEKPDPALLPTPRQLRRSTIAAVIGAAVIGVGVYLPAEYGIDPTGMGNVLGLTEMGEIKQQLAREAAEDEAIHGGDQSSSVIDGIFGLFVGAAHAQEAWTDTLTFTLAPDAATEVKLVMAAGDVAEYAWVAEGGRINFDLHAHGEGQSIDYDRGRGATSGEGSIEAPFPGEHGWFWRNRDDADVTITLQLRGAYSEVVRSE
ncbi:MULTISPECIES: transmembrane anchor protein [unclassified Paracoccus (in: a-proteobacteria)]|uniref:transmembrane anchor protein n=1 Tax=unclassified Paracoccus (in: a-proteobacteria) TaxID=2688777 RepID=UPI001FFE2686|nr:MULTISPECIES: transmembrane anchor protein [unclassified Paracoccus (in: a-proteobacteria)]